VPCLAQQEAGSFPMGEEASAMAFGVDRDRPPTFIWSYRAISSDLPLRSGTFQMPLTVNGYRLSNSVLLLVAVSVGVAVVQLLFGVRVVGGYSAAHDGPFAIASFVQFKDELLAGHIPRWSISGFSGLGSPIFYFYPPGVYSVATLLAVLLPGASPATIIGVAGVLLRVAAIVTCFLWLRQRVTADAALLGGGLYALMPWVSVLNPQARLAFAECGATVLLPLAFLAVDIQRSRLVATIVSLAIVICALTFTHLPTLVATGGLLVIYGALLNDTWQGRLRSIASVCGGIALGIGMAACYLLPALGLLNAISSFALWDYEHQPEQHFILAANTFNLRFGLLVNAGLMAPLLMVIIFCGAAIIKGRAPMALVGTFGVAIFLAVPPSAPIWALLIPMRLIQFPGRFLVPASLFASSLVAIVVPSQGPTLRRCVLIAAYLLGAGAITFSICFGDGMSSGETRTRQALAHPQSNAPEYVPAEATAPGWLDFIRHDGDVKARASEFVSRCVQRLPSSDQRIDDRLRFDVTACAGSTVFPQFFFPGWGAETDTGKLVVTSDPTSGLVSIAIPRGTNQVTLYRTWLMIEHLGLLVSVVSLGLWLGLLYASSRLRRKPRAGS
jgi:hypothetical protein